MEGYVLFWVEHFKQGRCRVAIDGVLGYFINFIQYEDGVARATFDETLNDAAGHGTYVGASMSAYFGFVMYSTQ